MKGFMKMGLLIGACSFLACCGPDDPGTDGGPIDHLDGSNPDGGVDGGVDAGITDGGNTDGGQTDGGATDAGPDGGITDAGPDADSDWEFALAVFNGRKWLQIREGSPTPTLEGTFLLDEHPISGCTTGKRLSSPETQNEYCFDPKSMSYAYDDGITRVNGKFTFCDECAGFAGALRERCLLHEHVSGKCHPDWSESTFVDGEWVLIDTLTYDGSTGVETYVQGD